MVKLFGWGKLDIEEGHMPLSQASKYASANEDDCMLCRLTGATAFVGLAAYSYWSGMYHINTKRQQIIKSGSLLGIRGRKASITTIAASLCGMGIYRLFN